MTFKGQLAADVGGVFLNNDEFSDLHTINGKQMSVLIDNSELLERAKISGLSATDGTYSANLLIYVSSKEYGSKPRIGTLLTLDGREYRVVNCTDEGGIYSVELGAVRM